MAKPEEIYVFNRDADDAQRLDFQHHFLNDVLHGEIIHRSIPQDKLKRVADVGMGTGIWLAEISDLLGRTTSANHERTYHGFDIADQQLDPVHRRKFEYTLHDVKKPFPTEHHGRYDLVHVRLLIYALKESELRGVVHNLIDLLAPGGYLQWEDLEFVTEELNKPNPRFLEILTVKDVWMEKNGVSRDLPRVVKRCAELSGLQDVTRVDYSILRDSPSLQKTQQWLYLVYKTGGPNMALGSGLANSETEAQKLVAGWLQEIEGFFARGEAFGCGYSVIAAMKPMGGLIAEC